MWLAAQSVLPTGVACWTFFSKDDYNLKTNTGQDDLCQTCDTVWRALEESTDAVVQTRVEEKPPKDWVSTALKKGSNRIKWARLTMHCDWCLSKVTLLKSRCVVCIVWCQPQFPSGSHHVAYMLEYITACWSVMQCLVDDILCFIGVMTTSPSCIGWIQISTPQNDCDRIWWTYSEEKAKKELTGHLSASENGSTFAWFLCLFCVLCLCCMTTTMLHSICWCAVSQCSIAPSLHATVPNHQWHVSLVSANNDTCVTNSVDLHAGLSSWCAIWCQWFRLTVDSL